MIIPEPVERDLYPYNCLKKFTIVPHQVINDKRLSAKDKILWIFYQSRPPGWCWNVSGTASALGFSRDAVIKSNKNLKKYGYLVIRQVNAGKFGRTKYYLDGEPETTKENEKYGENQDQQKSMVSGGEVDELPSFFAPAMQ